MSEKTPSEKIGTETAYHDYMEGTWYRENPPYYFNNGGYNVDEFWKAYHAEWNRLDNADRGYNPHDMSGDASSPDWKAYHA